MGCQEFREDLMECAAGTELPAHARECAACAAELASLRKTMSLLDGWQAPQPSAYFDTRLNARLRDVIREETAQARGFRGQLARLFRPARIPILGGALAIAALVGVSVYHPHAAPSQDAAMQASAVKDLQTLDNNYDLMQDLDNLDSSSTQVNDAGL